MGSSANGDSGKVPGKRKSFSETCSLLSRYMKRNGSLGDLRLGLYRPGFGAPLCRVSASEDGFPTRTMNLLPMIEKSGHNPAPTNVSAEDMLPFSAAAWSKPGVSVKKSAALETAPMTVFYAGRVLVFDDFPAEKAKEIMMLAAAEKNRRFPTCSPTNAARSPAESVTSIPSFPAIFRFPTCEYSCIIPQSLLDSDLPIARKNSLTRFLERRKDRITERAPYPSRIAPATPFAGQAWLGL